MGDLFAKLLTAQLLGGEGGLSGLSGLSSISGTVRPLYYKSDIVL
jgi:hypothetical protein